MKKIILSFALIGILLLSGCGKDTSASSTNTGSSTISVEAPTHTYEDPYVVDIAVFKDLLTTYSDENGELLYNMFVEWDGEHNNWAALKRTENYESNPNLYLSDGDYKYEPCYLLGLDIFYMRTGQILTSPINSPVEEDKVTTIEVVDEPMLNPETNKKMSMSETFDYLYERATKHGDTEASYELMSYLNPTAEFIESLTLEEFKDYFFAYTNFFSGEEVVFNEEPTNEVWEQIRTEFINGINESK